MKLIHANVEILHTNSTDLTASETESSTSEAVKQELLNNIYKQIEIAGRTCYKSEDKITDTSAKEFTERMIKSGHTAMLEHGTVYLKCPIEIYYPAYDDEMQTDNPLDDYDYNKYSVCEEIWDGDGSQKGYCYVTTNYRVLVENNWLTDLKYLCKPTEFHKKRTMVRFICDRGVSHELVRHKRFCAA